MTMDYKVYVKAGIAILGALLTAAVGFTTDGELSDVELVNIAIAGVSAATVYFGKNVPSAKYTKAILAGLMAGLAFLTTAILGGIDTNELLQLGVILGGALGVYQFPNKDENALY